MEALKAAGYYDDYIDNTEKIKTEKRSIKLKKDIDIFKRLKKEGCSDISLYEKQCVYMVKDFKDLFSKLYDDSLNISILDMLIKALEDIENGIIDQNDASIKIGQILKDIYIDNKINKKKSNKTMSWSEYKHETNFDS